MGSSANVSTPADQLGSAQAHLSLPILHGMRRRRDQCNPTATDDKASPTRAAMAEVQRNRVLPQREVEATALARIGQDGLSQSTDASTEHGYGHTPFIARPTCEVGQSTSPVKLTTVAFAIDTSSSTDYAGILGQERKAVLELASHLTPAAKAAASVLGWNSTAAAPLRTNRIAELRTEWGTDPTVLLSDAKHRRLLQACSMWFLLTDGAISRSKITRFAQGVSDNGLHGKASVVILFGIRPPRPAHCNISVGQAIFGIARDCAFFFHDVSTEEVFALQCKGCFRSLLPADGVEIIIDDQTGWKDIPRISYDMIARVSVPKPQQLDPNTVFLESGRVVNLDDLYSDRAGPEVAAEILDNDDDLKSVLLTAQNMGKSKEIEDWVSKQRSTRETGEFADRPDLGGSAVRVVRDLVAALAVPRQDPSHIEILRRSLRDLHQKNWIAFMSSLKANHDNGERRNVIVNHALERVHLNRQSPSSPVMMSPVSPVIGRKSRLSPPDAYDAFSEVPEYVAPAHRDSGHRPGDVQTLHSTASDYAPPPTHLSVWDSFSPPASPSSPLSYWDSPHSAATPLAKRFPSSPFPNNPELSDLLYTRGYRAGSGLASAKSYYGFCSLCGGQESPLALLLKAKPTDVETEGDFPKPNSQSDIKFPLAMGNYPETDIISSFVSCEKCAQFMYAIGKSPVDTAITGVIPLVPLSIALNHRTAMRELNIALEKRFNTSILDQIFLSILYSKLDEIKADSSPQLTLTNAIHWQCRNIISQISLPSSLSSSFDPTDNLSYTSLSTTMSAILPDFDHTLGNNSLLYYPIDGFITLLRGSLELGFVHSTDHAVKKAVFQRLLFHMVEQQASLREEKGEDAALAQLKQVSKLVSSDVKTLSIDLLEQETHLLDEEACASFRRLGGIFEWVDRDGAVAIKIFLQLLADFSWTTGNAESVFGMLKTAYAESLVFKKPWECGEEDEECSV